ncbi:protoporphyrinogen oxidase [Gracilibacillus halophilus YIM-C55.5]|uniref:Coproporphyrinogen III oxidase n=1 Tax=Gracilibacillus halophilus YIM-C55.5 TaxID=1308866 RepID=N4WHD5_9BACI|nr:protoporphyrinogen oxidase [Gracilibacillus halophilus]ENH95587.1 protoporphyrinogen oxidase [Gracilibacillus halophilus YIM-C55.5]
MSKITVIGGGIAGLTAAYYLQTNIRDESSPYQVELYEASNRIGGKIQTEKRNGFTIERGPDSFLIRKKSAERLAREVGLGDKLVKNGTGKSYILVGDTLHSMPQGSHMGIPTQLRPFLSSSLFSWSGKFRALTDFVRPKGEAISDQSVGQFFRRRLGDDVLENVIEPLLSGIYAGDIDELSLMATFPHFYQLEQDYGSLIKGIQKTTANKGQQTSGKKRSMFYSIEGGLSRLVEAIEEQLHPGTVQTEMPVTAIEKAGNQYKLTFEDGSETVTDAVIVTTPFPVLKRMFTEDEAIQSLDDMHATSVANVALAYDQSAIKQDIDGTGFVVSRNSDYRITACTWTHKKWPETVAPEGKALLRCYVGKPGDEDVVHLSDEELKRIVLHDLNKVMDIEGDPLFSVVTRWHDAMPQYRVGHKQMVDTLEDHLRTVFPGVFVAGNSYRGIGLPDCIDQAERAVQQTFDYFAEQSRY